MSGQSSDSFSSNLVGTVQNEDNVERTNNSLQSLSHAQLQTEQPLRTQPITPAQHVTKAQMPREFDVLFGRGKPFQKHLGNVRMRIIFERNRKRYQSASNADKPMIAKQVIAEIRNHHSPVRFLKRLTAVEKDKDFLSPSWYQTTEEEVYKKVTHGLRSKKSVPMYCQVASQTYNNRQQPVLPVTSDQQATHFVDKLPESGALNIDTRTLQTNPGMEIRDYRKDDDTKPSPTFDANTYNHQQIMPSSIPKNNTNTRQASMSLLDWSAATEDMNKQDDHHTFELSTLDAENHRLDRETMTSILPLSAAKPIVNPQHAPVPVGRQNNEEPGVHASANCHQSSGFAAVPARIQLDSNVSNPQRYIFENNIQPAAQGEIRLPFASKSETTTDTDSNNIKTGLHLDRIRTALESIEAGEDSSESESMYISQS